MSGLVFRINPNEGYLRSVGAPPNGVVAVGHPDSGATWVIDPTVQLTPVSQREDPPPGGIVMEARAKEGGLGEGAIPITAEELVDGLADNAAADCVHAYLVGGLMAAVQTFAPKFQFEGIAEELKLCFETRAALAEAGWIKAIE